ncbi:MAG: hypothetical protein GY925_06760 [Actinomycetia bacterium]|nr:hypothetical protein [Actinomycetes bacterium]
MSQLLYRFLAQLGAVTRDFFTVDTAFLRRYYVLFLISIETRQVFYAGTTATRSVSGPPKPPASCS